MLIWFEVLLIIYCGLLGMCLICDVYVKSSSYTCFMKFS